jgi:YggT family protein
MGVRGFFIQFVNIFADIIIFAIFVRVILSWIRPTGSKGKVFIFLFEITEPILSFFRKFIPRIGMIDITPIIVFLVIELLRGLIIGLLI